MQPLKENKEKRTIRGKVDKVIPKKLKLGHSHKTLDNFHIHVVRVCDNIFKSKNEILSNLEKDYKNSKLDPNYINRLIKFEYILGVHCNICGMYVNASKSWIVELLKRSDSQYKDLIIDVINDFKLDISWTNEKFYYIAESYDVMNTDKFSLTVIPYIRNLTLGWKTTQAFNNYLEFVCDNNLELNEVDICNL